LITDKFKNQNILCNTANSTCTLYKNS